MKETDEERGIGAIFQSETKYSPETIGRHSLDWENMPELYKSYPESTPRQKLPEPAAAEDANLWKVIEQRRSVRNYFPDSPLKLETLSLLLWATQGITAQTGDLHLRSAPSAGALYPIETYVMVRAVEGLEPGIYHFRPLAFDLECIRPGDFSRSLARAALGQGMVARAQAAFVWTAILERSRWKYRQRAYRYIYLDAGHIAQNLYLAGTAAGVGICGIAAFFDDSVNAIVGVDGMGETVVYMASAGLPASDRRGS